MIVEWLVCLLLDFLQLIQSHCFKSPYCGSIAWYLINKSEPLNLIYSNKCQQIVLHSQHKKIKNLKRKKPDILSCRFEVISENFMDLHCAIWYPVYGCFANIFACNFHLCHNFSSLYTRELKMKSKRGEKIIEHETTLLNEKKNVDANIWSLFFNEFFSSYGHHCCCENVKGEID